MLLQMRGDIYSSSPRGWRRHTPDLDTWNASDSDGSVLVDRRDLRRRRPGAAPLWTCRAWTCKGPCRGGSGTSPASPSSTCPGFNNLSGAVPPGLYNATCGPAVAQPGPRTTPSRTSCPRARFLRSLPDLYSINRTAAQVNGRGLLPSRFPSRPFLSLPALSCASSVNVGGGWTRKMFPTRT